MQQNASTEYKSATHKVKQLYKAFWVTVTAFFNGFIIDSLEHYRVFKRKPSPFL
jgi:hypothetical protein